MVKDNFFRPKPASGKHPAFTVRVAGKAGVLGNGSIFVERDVWESGADPVAGYADNAGCANCGDSQNYPRSQLGAAAGPYAVPCCDGSMTFDAYRVVLK